MAIGFISLAALSNLVGISELTRQCFCQESNEHGLLNTRVSTASEVPAPAPNEITPAEAAAAAAAAAPKGEASAPGSPGKSSDIVQARLNSHSSRFSPAP